MTGLTTPIADLVETLLSSGQTRETVVRHVRAAEEILRHRLAELTTYRANAEDAADKKRQRWRQLKSAQRNGAGDKPVDVSAGHGENPGVNALCNNNSKKDSPKNSKGSEIQSGRADKNRGSTIPEDWQPNEKHFDIGVEFGMSEHAVNREATAMRDWAMANRNRAVARKADWDATFRNWLRSNRPKGGGHPNAPRNGSGGHPGGGSALGRMARGGR